jgi:FtsP/CotA-like multicopper oxidase with cupredoxin domain
MKKTFTFLFVLFIIATTVEAKTVEYDIDIDHKTVNFTGKDVQAIAVGGGIPAPTIEATEGDLLKVTFHNKMDVDTSIHWHGILLPNDQDGVPYITTMPIRAGGSLHYEYPIIQSGTYWYHSHTGLQEQRGVYGALVFHPKKETIPADHEYVVVLSDWNDENPDQVLRNLKKDGDYYALKKDAVQSWYKVFKFKAFWHRLKQAWTRMGPMDLSDVGYDVFLTNGELKNELGDARPGQRVRLRIINASSSSYFYIEFAGGDMEVVSVDGVDIEPFKAKRILIAVAETYDVIVTLPENKAYELRATSQDGTGYTSAVVGTGELVEAPTLPRPNPMLMMNHSKMGSEPGGQSMSEHHGHGGHDMPSGVVEDYKPLRALQSTKLPDENPVREVVLELTGNMERYIWSFNNKTMKEEDTILIRKGENVRFIMPNKTMMHHPIHLHGHFFRVLNGQGDYSPLKHTVDVKPLQTTIIEFEADQEKDWFFHCHNLYHMKTGMTRVVHYEGTERDPELVTAWKKDKPGFFHDWYWNNYITAQSNKDDGYFSFSDDRNIFEVEWKNNYTGEYEVEPSYERSFTRFFSLFVGGDFERDDDDEVENLATWGFRYVLPLLVDFQYRMDHRGTMKLSFESSLQLTNRIQVNGEYEISYDLEDSWNYGDGDIEHEYVVELEYRATKMFSLIGNYDSDYGGGGGIRIRF